MTLKQVAEYLRLHRLTVYKYVSQGKLKSSNIQRGKIKVWVVSKHNLDEYLNLLNK